MPYRFISNKISGKTIIHVAGANSGSIMVIASNATNNSELRAHADEVVRGAYIRKLIWGTDTNWLIQRNDANVTINVAVLTQTGEMRLDGTAITLLPHANISATTSSANSFLIMELDKLFSNVATPGGY